MMLVPCTHCGAERPRANLTYGVCPTCLYRVAAEAIVGHRQLAVPRPRYPLPPMAPPRPDAPLPAHGLYVVDLPRAMKGWLALKERT